MLKIISEQIKAMPIIPKMLYISSLVFQGMMVINIFRKDATETRKNFLSATLVGIAWSVCALLALVKDSKEHDEKIKEECEEIEKTLNTF